MQACVRDKLEDRFSSIATLLFQAFTSCTLGVEYVGFIMICYGVSSSVSAFVFTRITRWTGYSVLFITGKY